MGIDVQIAITVVHSPKPREVHEVSLLMEEGCTVEQAVRASGLISQLASVDECGRTCGVWGKKVANTHVLRDHDRVEIYRLLTVDPKVARRERFVRQGAKKAAGLFARRRAGSKAGY